MSESPVSPFLNTREAAKYLRLRPATLERWRSVGGGPAYRKLGGRVVYAQRELDAFAEAGRKRSTSDPGPASA